MHTTRQPGQSGDDRLMNEKEVADFLGISVRFLQTDRSSKLHQIPYFRVGARVRYRLSEVRDWLERHAVRASSGEAR